MDIPCKQSQLVREPNLLMLKNRQSCISQVVKVILTSVRITAAPRPFISIRQVAPMCVPSFNVRFLCFSFYLHLIGSAGFNCVPNKNGHTDTQT